jgi:hypothetical protein
VDCTTDSAVETRDVLLCACCNHIMNHDVSNIIWPCI